MMLLSMLGCVDDERDESGRLEMQQLRAVEKGQHHPQSHYSQQYCHTNNNNNKTYTPLSLPLSLFSNGTTMTAAVTAVNVTTTTATAASSSAAEGLRDGCCEENDHYQRLLRMANM